MPNPNPNTSGLKPFPKGKSGNPGGKSAEQVAIERRNADAAMRIRERLLKAVEAKLEAMAADGDAISFVEPAMLKLLKDAEDRGLGAPVQPLTSPDGSMSPKGLDASKLSDETLREIIEAANAAKP